MERVMKHWSRLPREAAESPSLAVSKRHVDVGFRAWFSVRLDSARLMVGLDLRGRFQPKQVYETLHVVNRPLHH